MLKEKILEIFTVQFNPLTILMAKDNNMISLTKFLKDIIIAHYNNEKNKLKSNILRYIIGRTEKIRKFNSHISTYILELKLNLKTVNGHCTYRKYIPYYQYLGGYSGTI